jgi:hypothetical protein
MTKLKTLSIYLLAILGVIAVIHFGTSPTIQVNNNVSILPDAEMMMIHVDATDAELEAAVEALKSFRNSN